MDRKWVVAILNLAYKFFEMLFIKKLNLCPFPQIWVGLYFYQYSVTEVMLELQDWFIKDSTTFPCWLEYLLLEPSATIKEV